eukprot:Phypoly_transcript_19202.p1 GENE.Phypoly_transcript_19202~~Phypoly_transcript_19202.p1  ORF type:complete len:149 (-),score=16.18 Phypoly_transcript_19202:143-589(-)
MDNCKDIFSTIPEDPLRYIMNSLEFFGDIVFGATCKRFRELYLKFRRSENCVRAGYFYALWYMHNSDWNEKSAVEKKLCSSGNYEIVRTVAELCWLGVEMAKESELENSENDSSYAPEPRTPSFLIFFFLKLLFLFLCLLLVCLFSWN